MSDSSKHDTAVADGQRFAAAVARWSADPELAALVTSGSAVLILDEAAQRVLHASDAARALQSSIAGSDGRIFEAVALPGQIRRIGPLTAKPKLARLRFDRRGIAVPTTCRVVRCDVPGGVPVLLVAMPGPPGASSGSDRTVAEPDARPAVEPSRETAEPTSIASDRRRLVWRSDAFGVIVEAAGLSADIASALIGRSLASLQGRGRNGLLAAVDTRQRFGPVAIVLTSFGADDVEIDLSGAPATLPPEAFAGYRGFGTLRGGWNDPPDIVAEARREPGDAGASEVPSQPQGRNDNAAPQPVALARPLDLSLHEHAAFREIARALGARFAGDETETGDAAAPPPIVAPDAVPPFDAEAAAVRTALEGLPAGVLVRCGGQIVFASRRARDLVGLADGAAIVEVDRVRHLFEAVEGVDQTHAVPRSDGAMVQLLVDRSRMEWFGEPADLLLLRAGTDCDASPVAARDGEEQGEGTDLPVVMPETAARPRPDPDPRSLRARVDRLLSDEDPRSEDEASAPPGPHRLEADYAERLRVVEGALRRKLDFFGKASQDIRAPVGAIVSVADAMLMEQFGPLGEHYRDYLRDIHESGGRVLAHLDDLVTLARIEAGRTDLSFADLRFNDLVSGCIAEVQPQALRDRIVVRTSLAPDLKTLLADERSMRKAALGVLANALHRTDPGGQVIVSTNNDEHGGVLLRVRDTGAGLSAEEIEQALEPFRHRPPMPRKDGASGLGLTLTKALVEANRGRFKISSRSSEGTLVEMVFPPHALSA